MIRDLLAYGDMLESAFLTGLITEGEFLLIDNITANYKVYERRLKEAVELGIITDDDERQLRGVRKNIYQNALRTALKNPLNESEENILELLKKALGLDEETLSQIEATVKSELK
ncbi:MAG: hypothetical protein V3T58_03225 [Candidatus Hydrothermarchaeales archaeon]